MSKTHYMHIVSHIITSVKRMPFFVDGSNAACPAAGINPDPTNNGYSSSKHRFCFSVSGRTETVRTNISPQKYNGKLLQQRKK